ncbi:M23 family metallopeptidase [Synechococcus sp. MIT S9508]|uniref:M23 family metallopeptidase n=1 Tax=Synechococcus sp. MIT S9508 TaxID=1801629 RepID=UPI0007BBD626|nr:M23 family metallopeptidase [Synechococcus sp. MIT S9508]KZR89148.1 Murein DD-endopeptidase MepM [Synechococcus sp. MIT S9508]
MTSSVDILNGLAQFKIQEIEKSALHVKSGKNVFQALSPLLNKRSMAALFEEHCLHESAAVEAASAPLSESAWAAESFEAAPDSVAQVCSFASFADYLNELSLKAYSLPASGVFTSGFGPRWSRHHSGIDIANHVGTSIFASRRGEVVFVDYLGAYGLMVEIKHPDGYRTRYAHCNEALVRVGETVSRGDLIAKMGNTGRSTGPHLHFEIRSPENIALNPASFLEGILINQKL